MWEIIEIRNRDVNLKYGIEFVFKILEINNIINKGILR